MSAEESTEGQRPIHPPHPSERLLAGAVDAHLHANPFINDQTMLLDVFEVAREAKLAGMSAIVVKSHFGSSCEAAFLANRYAGGATVIGGVTLNWSVGGFNPDAVRVAAHQGYDDGFRPGRVVWMPERSSLNRANLLGLDADARARGLTPYPGGDTSRELIPEAREILELIAELDLVLATSHLSPREALGMMEVGRELGVTRMVVTHATHDNVRWTLEDKRRAVDLGALIEEAAIVWEPAMASFKFAPSDAEEIFEGMREIGPEHYVLATDCGFAAVPRPVEALRVFIALLLGAGFTEAEVTRMASENATRLFRLDEVDERPPVGRPDIDN